MAIPDYQAIMLPLLRLLGDGSERSLSEAISDQFHLTPEERHQLLPSDTSTVIGSRWLGQDLHEEGGDRGYVDEPCSRLRISSRRRRRTGRVR